MDIYKEKINRSNLLLRLGCLTRRWRKILDTEFQSSGITDATWRPLLHLHLLGDGMRQKDLAASLGIEGPSLVRLIDSLINKGLVKRSEDDRDRRAKRLSLTPEGFELVSRIQEMVIDREDGLFKSFSDDELSKLADFVQRLESSLVDAQKRCKT